MKCVKQNSSKISIRAAQPSDCTELLRLMEAIVEYERGSDFRLTEAELLKRGFGEEPEFGAYVADVGNGHLVGMAVHYEIPFMHSLKPLFMLKWLYVDPQQRGQSIGRSLVKAICKHAVALGYKQFNWFVLHDNENAKHFYRSLGASKDPEWARWIMEEEAVTSLAAEG